MQIEKYEKKGNGNYLLYLSDGRKFKINEDVILKYKLLYKKEIDEFLLEEILQDNNNYDIYNRCVKYISVRLRSINEMKNYMQRLNVSPELIDKVITKLINNNLLNDELYTKAYIKDKLNFTSKGPLLIEADLKKDNIDLTIINRYMALIDPKIIDEKINKQIGKLINSHKNKPNLRNKIYSNLMNLGYPYSQIIENLNKYDLK